LPGVRERTTRGTTKHSPGIDAGEALLVLRRCGFAPDNPSPRKTDANTRKTTPMPDESRVKSTIATMRNTTPARAFPTACLDTLRSLSPCIAHDLSIVVFFDGAGRLFVRRRSG